MTSGWQPIDVDGADEERPGADPGELVIGPDEFRELVARRPAWQALAACRGGDRLELFFPGQGNPATEARAICAVCMVRGECEEYAKAHGPELVGVWAGASQNERRRWQRPAPQPRTLTCEHCGARFEHTGKATYCSGKCRRAASRARRAVA